MVIYTYNNNTDLIKVNYTFQKGSQHAFRREKAAGNIYKQACKLARFSFVIG